MSSDNENCALIWLLWFKGLTLFKWLYTNLICTVFNKSKIDPEGIFLIVGGYYPYLTW
jgi:hypothetical protein